MTSISTSVGSRPVFEGETVARQRRVCADVQLLADLVEQGLADKSLHRRLFTLVFEFVAPGTAIGEPARERLVE
jgi:hypothetical protein